MTVYLLHLTVPLSRGTSTSTGQPLKAQHYIGYAHDLKRRLAHHRNGTGAHFTAVAVQAGAELKLARVWDGADRTWERRLKNYKKAHLLCPLCDPHAEGRMKASS